MLLFLTVSGCVDPRTCHRHSSLCVCTTVGAVPYTSREGGRERRGVGKGRGGIGAHIYLLATEVMSGIFLNEVSISLFYNLFRKGKQKVISIFLILNHLFVCSQKTGAGIRTHWLYPLQRGKNPPHKNPWSVEYPFIVITLRSTLTLSSSTY